MTNKRDCEHGSQIGKCDTCDLFEAYNEIETLRTQLTKANERVEELETFNKELRCAIHQGSASVVKSLLKKDKEGEASLNKFTIEKKTEAFNAVKNEIKTVGGLELYDVVEFIDEQLEQLRKEQASE